MATKTDPRTLVNTQTDPALSNTYPETFQTFPQLTGVNDVFITQQHVLEKITNVFQGGVSTDTVNVFTRNQSCSVVTLSSIAGSIAMDVSLSNNFRLWLTEDATLETPTNATDGMVINLQVRQGSAGNWTLTFPGNFSWPGSVIPTITTDQNAYDFISMFYDGLVGTWRCVCSQNFGVPV